MHCTTNLRLANHDFVGPYSIVLGGCEGLAILSQMDFLPGGQLTIISTGTDLVAGYAQLALTQSRDLGLGL